MPGLALYHPPSPGRPHEPASLRRLFPSASFVGCADVRATDAVEDSRSVRPGMLFAARPGRRCDGAAHAADAVARGAAALLVRRPLAGLSVPQCVVPDVARAFGALCAQLAGRPMRTVRTVGVTGTNGKTTVAWLVRSLLQSAGRSCGLLGTIEYSDGVRAEPATLTTPDSRTFWDWFGAMADHGTGHAAVELSSHALHQERAAGAELEVAVVTNVTHDHLDYHGTTETYLTAKGKIMQLVRSGGAVIVNQDDPSAERLAALVPDGLDLLTFGLEQRAAVGAADLVETPDGVAFTLSLRGRKAAVETSLVGRHNVANCLAAAAVAERFGLSIDEIAAGLGTAAAPPGRMERVVVHAPFRTFVDYAHTPDALAKAVAAARAVAAGRVIVVFGAGGERDATKRGPLGAAASAADVAVVTSDNPRGENPQEIIAAVRAGCVGTPCQTHAEPDRAAAIRRAVAAAKRGDVLLIAGKGHETTQILADGPVPFDDRQVAAAALAERFGKTPRRHAA